MKKKGFTLVELLAVIAILAILVIIALPNVLSMFTDAKKSTFKTEVQSIFKQAQTDFINDSINNSGPKWYCSGGTGTGTNGRATCKELNLTTTKEYAVAMLSDGTIQYIGVKDSSYVYGLERDGSELTINDIHESDIVDASSTNGQQFQLWTKRTVAKDDGGIIKPGFGRASIGDQPATY